MDVVGKKKRQNTNCLQAAVKLALPKARASDRNFCKRAAVLDYRREPSDKTLTYYTQEGQEVDAQRNARRLANDYWLRLITDRGNLMKKLEEYYQELHYRENFVTDTAFYVVIRATRGSSHLQGKAIPSFLSHFKTLCVGSVPGIEPPALQSSALPTELILPS